MHKNYDAKVDRPCRLTPHGNSCWGGQSLKQPAHTTSPSGRVQWHLPCETLVEIPE